MQQIALMAASLISVTIGAKLMTEQKVKSDSYTLSQIKQVVSAMGEGSKVTGIENKGSVYLSGGEQATLYDLDGDEGYLVLGDNYKIYDYQPSVELNEKASLNGLEFNPVSRSFMTEDERCVSIVDRAERATDMPERNLKEGSFVDYGCGQISSDQLVNYVNNKFPGGELDDEHSIPITRFSQMEISCYWKGIRKDGVIEGYTSEANCGLCAAYTVFHYLVNYSAYRNSSFGGFPKQTNKTRYYPRSQEPETYQWVTDNVEDWRCFQNHPGYGSWEAKEFDGLYIALRQAGLELDLTTPFSGISTDEVVIQMESVAHQFGLNTFQATRITDFNAYTGTPAFKNFLTGGKPLFFASRGSTYGNHDMAVSGYKYYKRTVKVLFWDKIEWATFLELGDGHSLETMYFDITRYFWEHHGDAEFINYAW